MKNREFVDYRAKLGSLTRRQKLILRNALEDSPIAALEGQSNAPQDSRSILTDSEWEALKEIF